MTEVKAEAKTDPILRIKFEDGAGKQIVSPVEVRIPGEISVKLAKMLILELVVKKMRGSLDAAVTALGLK